MVCASRHPCHFTARLKVMKTIVPLITLTLFSVSLHAEEETFLGNLALEPEVLSFTDVTNWDTNSLPGQGDHVRITGGRFSFDPQGSEAIEMDSMEAAEFGGFIKSGEFRVVNDIQARGMFVGASTKRFEWGGEFVLSTPNHWEVALTLAASLAPDNTTKFFGGDLTFTKSGFLGFTFFRSIAKSFPNNQEPILALKGTLEFYDDSRLLIEGKEMESSLPPGDYLLVRAEKINGTPALEFQGWSSEPAGAKLREEDGQLILEIP